MNTEETKAADALWEDYPNFKRPIVPIEFVDAFLPKIKEKGLSEVRITGELSPFNADFKCHVALVSRESWTSNPTKMYDLHVAAFDLKHMPGCGGILMSHGSYVSHSKRRTGLGDLMQEMKMWIASQLEAGMLLATVVVGNEAEEAILGKHGWQPIGPTFRNVHTENNVQMWQKILT